MPSVVDYITPGKITGAKGGLICLSPRDTNYELHLVGAYDGPLNARVNAVVRAKARKVWTVPTGGNFVTPIFGTPRIVQGRIRAIDGNLVVIRCGLDVIVELPESDDALDLAHGGLSVGAMVNATLQPGATFELAPAPTAV